MQSFISHSNQYSLVDPNWFDRGLTIDLKKIQDAELDAELDAPVVLETEFHEITIFSFSTQTSTKVTEKQFLQ